MFFTEKRDGTIKGRCVYNGKPTRQWLDKEDSASPTVAIESLTTLGQIDAHENRDVMTVDIPNMFIQTGMPKARKSENHMIMKITGVLSSLTVSHDGHQDGQGIFQNGVIAVVVRLSGSWLLVWLTDC